MPYDITQFSPGYGGTINSSGNVVNIADVLDESTGQFKPPAMKQLTFQSGATATGNGTVQDVSGYSVLMIRVAISGTATVSFETSVDGTNYNAITGMVGSTATGSNTSVTNDYRFNIGGVKFFRARISSYTSGTIDVIGYASSSGLIVTGGAVQSFGSGDTNSTTTNLQGVGAYNLLYDGSNWVRQRSINAYSDGNQITAGVPSGIWAYNGAAWDRQRAGKVYKHIEYLNLADNAGTTIWTPASTKKFRLMGISVSISAAGRLSIRDGSTGTTYLQRFSFNGAGTADFNFGNGWLSTTADNVLEVRNNSGATVNVWVTAWGTEE